MSHPTLFKEIIVGSQSLHLVIQDQNRWVEFDNHFFNHIWLLSQQFSLLTDSTYLKEFAEVSNFLWKGPVFQFIENIADYQNSYLTQVELEKKHASDVFPYRLTDYKIFDVSVMHDPQLTDGLLRYFVYHTVTGLPYRVICLFPYTCTSSLVHYQILPIKEDPIENK